MRRNAVAAIAALLAVILLGVAGVYLYRQAMPVPKGEGTKPTGATAALSPAPATPPAVPQTASPQPPQAPQTEAADASPEEPMVVPSFDVVLIEPSGEGVLAGRAAPGWTVELDSGGIKIAEATADRQGEWNIILDKKLAPGDYRLQLRTISPDGTRALTSQQTVPVAVGNAKEQVASAPQPGGQTGDAAVSTGKPGSAAAPVSQESGSPETTGSAAGAASPGQSSAAPPQAKASGAAPQDNTMKATVTFKVVDYQDTGADGGKMKLSGTSAPGATIELTFDGKPLATAKADARGQWQAESDMKLGEGAHTLTAVPAGRSDTAEPAAIAIERRPAPPKAPEPVPASPQVAAAEEANNPSSATDAAQSAGRPDIYEIRRGDTLWDIAKRYLGSGLRYTSIFQGNRETIRNPNLILPAQKVKMPPS